MKIGIIVFSKTGHTYEAAFRLAAKLKTIGHEAIVDRILVVDDKETKPENMRFEYQPDITGYDLLIFGAPVWAFSLCEFMRKYLTELSLPQGMRTMCYVTMGLSFLSFGGKRAIKQMEAVLEEKGSLVLETATVSWGATKREKNLEAMTHRFCRSVQA